MGGRFTHGILRLTGISNHIRNASLRIWLSDARSVGHERGQVGLVLTRHLLILKKPPDEDSLGFGFDRGVTGSRTNTAWAKERVDVIHSWIGGCLLGSCGRRRCAGVWDAARHGCRG